MKGYLKVDEQSTRPNAVGHAAQHSLLRMICGQAKVQLPCHQRDGEIKSPNTGAHNRRIVGS
jgi:hypothetical protein